jgi:hypothetical protein
MLLIRRTHAVLCSMVFRQLRKWGELYELMVKVSMTILLVPSNLLKQLQTSNVDLPLVCCFAYRAVRLVRVAAIGEAALAQVGQEFGEASFYRREIQMMQAEQLHAGAVDEVAVGIQVIQAYLAGCSLERA